MITVPSHANSGFQSTLLQEERPVTMQHLTAASRISIHAPTRGATQRLLLKNMQKKFQSTLLQEERLKNCTLYKKVLTNFNPRSYKRSDKPLYYKNNYLGISIHAPTRGATFMQSTYSVTFTISIHAPTRGATQGIYSKRKYLKISIHAPTRGATVEDSQHITFIDISIHAPTRGATVVQNCKRKPIYNFNPRSYKRSDSVRASFLTPHHIFQSTLLQEERH